jgi:anthranilate synthase/aminodeoxychorismate synthase-like glutamine amidotransferase
MILLIDNYDSFVHNLARYVTRLGGEAHVVRNDAIDARGIRDLKPCAIIISPGPCAPRQAGCSLDVVRQLNGEVPMLGICLGHQAIAEALGAEIVRSPEPVHGRSSPIEHDGSTLFAGLPSPLTVGRYHSLAVRESTLPGELRVTARSGDGVIMAFEHVARPVYGVQFHPESVLTEGGFGILANFLQAAGQSVAGS